MKTVVFHFDPVSPFVHLAFARLPQVLEGCSYSVEYRPLLFAALLAHHDHKGPAEIEPKRAWTLRHVAWLAQHHGVALQAPARHPFNPLPLLRLALAADAAMRPNRRVVDEVLRHVWEGGGDAEDPARLAALRERLGPTAHDPQGDAVKAALRRATDEAVAAGVFGVPAFGLDGRLFWGLDALPMLRDALRGDAWFDGPAWDAAGAPRPGVRRRPAAPGPGGA